MPKHRLLAILRILEVDAITHQVFPEAIERKALVEKAHHREGLQKLGFPLEHQIPAVSIENNAVALQHIDHLEKMVRCIGQQWTIRQQTGHQLIEIGYHLSGRGSLGHSHQERAPAIEVTASWLRPVVAASLRPTSKWGTRPSRSTPRDRRMAGIC